MGSREEIIATIKALLDSMSEEEMLHAYATGYAISEAPEEPQDTF